MLPLLREPMVVEVAALRRPARLGEILVFTEGENYVVHRVVARRVAGYVTAGDANGSRTEEVAEDAILGRVEAVWSDASPSARRVDGLRFRLRGAWYTHGRPLRLALWRVLARIRSIQHAS
jgi:hypothetical protein